MQDPKSKKIPFVKTVFWGTSAVSAEVLGRLIAGGIKPSLVCTQPDRPRGRGQVNQPTMVKLQAQASGIKVATSARPDTPQMLGQLKDCMADLFIVAAYGNILKPNVLQMPAYGTVNIHPSLLPLYRGPSPVTTAILNGATHTGVSLILLDDRLDGGPILCRSEQMPIEPDETAADLRRRLFRRGADLLIQSVDDYIAQAIQPYQQDENRATYTHKIAKTDGLIQWNTPVETLMRTFRAYHPWPGIYTTWHAQRLKICAIDRSPSDSQLDVGQVDYKAPKLRIGCCDGVLCVTALQLAGRRVLQAPEFVNGTPSIVGARLPS